MLVGVYLWDWRDDRPADEARRPVNIDYGLTLRTLRYRRQSHGLSLFVRQLFRQQPGNKRLPGLETVARVGNPTTPLQERDFVESCLKLWCDLPHQK